MVNKISFKIEKSDKAVEGYDSRFGGQPTWKEGPSWPLSIESNEKLLFLGQILLEEYVFPGSNGMIAYIFIDKVGSLYDQAVTIVLQPGTLDVGDLHGEFKYIRETTGPMLYETFKGQIIDKDRTYIIIKSYEQEKEIALAERYGSNDLDIEFGFRFKHKELAGNKIGGQPLYIQGLDVPPDYFTSNEWLLLLQLAPVEGYWNVLKPNFYPFFMELGEFGILSIFIKKDHSIAKAFIQQG